MADKQINELEAATAVTATDLFVLQQAGTAKKLESQVLENWLLAMAQGRGGIISIAKTGSAGTDPVVDTYTITFSDTTTTTFTVTNGLKGDTGDQTFVYIKYSNRDPIADTDLTDTPSPWMGICCTTATTAPTTYTSYTWYEIKGDKGDKGDNITISSTSVTYQEWSSGTQYPTGSWLPNPPQVTQGNYLWTRTIVNYSDGGQTVSYSVARNGLDGTGAVSSVCNQLPDNNGNVALSYADVGALPDSYQAPVTSVNNQTGTVVLDNEDLKAKYAQSVSASLSTAGWYRAVKYTASNANDANGYSGAIVHLDLSRSYVNTANESHSIDLALVNGHIKFVGEKSVSSSLGIDKVRYTKNGSVGYIDVHYKLANANKVSVAFMVGADETEQKKFTAETLQAVNDAPTGETIVTTYELSENGILKHTLSLESGYTAEPAWGGAWVAKVTDNLCLLHLGISGLTANANNYPVDLPSPYRPALSASTVCPAAGNLQKTANVYVESISGAYPGRVRVFPQDTYALIEIIYISE